MTKLCAKCGKETTITYKDICLSCAIKEDKNV